MQGLSASCAQQRFALTRCCDSNDKRSRRRRTREERRSMVESYINKYRISNSGKFPSLNLTHKEVGGSFYIVREIVRDIIQENRILGPGSPSMKGFNLEDCSKEHETEFLESSDQENHAIFSHVMHQGNSYLQENSRGADDHKSLVTIVSQEMAMGMSSLETELSAEIGLQVQVDSGRCEDHQIEHPRPLHEAVYQKVLVSNEDSQVNSTILAEAANMSMDEDEKYKTTPMAALPEEKVFVSSSTSLMNLLSDEDFPPLVSSSTKSSSDLACLRRDDLIGHQEAPIAPSLPNEQGELSVQIDNFSNLNRTEQIENSFSILTKEVPEPIPSGSETSCFPAPGIPCPEEPPAVQVHSSGSTRPESLASSAQESSANQLKDKHETDCSSKVRGSSREKGSCSSSIAANGSEEEIQSEGNQVWNAIEGFVAAVIKFWAQ